MATPSGSKPLRLHQRCELASYGRGEVLFVGQTSFSPGIWAGIALDEPRGKHDGVVQNKRYFTATPGHGLFIRPLQVNVIEDGDEEQREGESGEVVDEDDYVMEETVINPSPAKPTPRTSAASSRTPSRAATGSPLKPATAARPRPSSALRPASAVASSSLARARIGSPVTPAATSSISRSPTKTPARVSASAPMSRAGTLSRASRPSTTSPQSASGVRTGNAAAATSQTPAISRTAARQAVQAGKAPDTATARVGLRSVAKARPSMAPPDGFGRTPARTARTPATAAATRKPGVIPTPGPSRSNLASTAKTPAMHRTPTATSAVSSDRKGSAGLQEEDTEDLLAMGMDEGSLVNNLQSSSESADFAALADQQEEGLMSPSLRKGTTTAHQQEFMSLSSGPSLTALHRNTGEIAAMQRELEELRAKLRIAEKKREDDREKVKESERIQMESEQFLAAKPKLTAKQQELQDQLKDLHRMEKDWAMQKDELERQMSEMTDQLEIATLDREVAEEKAEGALEELRIVTDKVEELQVDIEVLREENALYEQGPVDDKDKLSVGYIQLEKQNERLKDALIRLRDMATESEGEQKRRITQLEKDLSALDDLQASYESVCGKLDTSDALLEDLKIQLDDALGAEEMLEQLTERNLALTEKVEEMGLTIEDLESLKELNDELEETHLETEKQLQEEVDLREMQLREHEMRIDSLEANIVDYEGTFTQFRELVLNLQSEVETLRNDDKARETAKPGDDQAMLNLNLKLQSSTLKSQAKTIELEIGRLQARQAGENLSMISPYLPKEFFENDRDACDSLLFFQRIAAKADIIKTVVEGSKDIAGNLVGIVEDSLIKVCKMRHSLAHFIVFSRQISAVIHLASVPTFLKAGRMYKELSSMEKRIDHYIDQLREEALNEEECGKEFNRFVKLLEDFDYLLVEQGNEGLYSDLAAKELGSAILFDLDLDTIAASLGFSKQSIAGLYNDLVNNQQVEGEEVPAEESLLRMSEKEISEGLFQPIQDLINNIRATKVPARKLLRRLSTLYDNGEAVKMDAIVRLPGLGRLTSQLVEFSTSLVNSFSAYTNEVRNSKAPFEMKMLLSAVGQATREALDQTKTGELPWVQVNKETAQLSQTVSELLGAATEQENVMKITGRHPWLSRVEEIKIQQSENHESQRVIAKQTEDLKDMYKQTKIRDELLQENTIKIERLTKQLQRSKDELNAVDVLKNELSDTTKRMKAYEEGNSALQGELEQLQREYERVLKEGGGVKQPSAMTVAEAIDGGGSDGGALVGPSVLTSGFARNPTLSLSSMETSYLVDQLEAIRGALRHVRLENSILKSKETLDKFVNLPILLSEQQQDSHLAQKEDPTKGLPKSSSHGKEKGGEIDVASEGRRLVKELMRVASSPRIVTLAKPQVSAEGDDRRLQRTWTPMAKLPQGQYWEQSQERSQIQRQIQSIHAKLNSSTMISLRV